MGNDHDRLDAVKKKGAMSILYATDVHGSLRFRDLEDHTDVSEPTIATRLDDLEEADLLDRTFFDEMPPRVEYSPTPRSEPLCERVVDLFEWAAERAASSREPTDTDDQADGQAGTCLYCASVDEAAPTEDGEDPPWFRTLDGLIDLIARTHAINIVIHVETEGPIRYSELKEDLDITSDTLLSTRLDDLEDSGLLVRKAYDEIPPRVEYSLTDDGHELAECLVPILAWSEQTDG